MACTYVLLLKFKKGVRVMNKTAKRFAVIFMTLAIMALSIVSCFAASAEDVSSVTTGITTIFDGLSSTFNFANIVSFLGVAIGAAGLLALGWFGLRKVVAMIQTALKRGRVKI